MGVAETCDIGYRRTSENAHGFGIQGMVNNCYSSSDRIFTRGRASVDAGMPTVKDLTSDLRNRLRAIRPEFEQVFELIEKKDPSVVQNYERLFEWIHLLLKVCNVPFNKLIHTDINNSIINGTADIEMAVSGEIAKLLEGRQADPKYDPNYLSALADYLPEIGRLKVFSLNYDCCLEDACRSADIDLITGFDPITKK